uniref:Ribonuclease A-domain domain-containing protein n=1 Tax=Poecilia reticulata TaxID=8081 RepID=A0A3P9P9V6_POERE
NAFSRKITRKHPCCPNQQVDQSSTEGEDCNRNMEGINYANCKYKNTFILDPDGELDSICSSGQTEEMITSEFTIFNCVHKTSRLPYCLYNGEDDIASYIVVTCVNGRPKHLKNLSVS